MPTWSHEPPQDPRGQSFEIVRAPIGQPLTAIVTSDHLVGCYTHFWKRRTIPCEGSGCRLCLDGKTPETDEQGNAFHTVRGTKIPCDGPPCEACRNGIPFRWHAYQSVFLKKTLAHVIFECTAQASLPFVEYRKEFGTTRGCLFTAGRRTFAPNSRIVITTKPFDISTIRLPKPPNIIKCLAILWDLPTKNVTVDGIHPGTGATRLNPKSRRD